MSNETVRKYAEAWLPEEIRIILKALGNETRMAIISYLSKTEEATFKDLMNELELKSNKLTYHLKKLLVAGLVHRYYSREDDKERVYYTLSQLGAHIVEAAPLLYIPRELLVKETRREEGLEINLDYNFRFAFISHNFLQTLENTLKKKV